MIKILTSALLSLLQLLHRHDNTDRQSAMGHHMFKRSTHSSSALKALLSLALATAVLGAHAAEGYVTGTVTNLTSTPAGLLIMVDAGQPTNCAGAPGGWMLIRTEHKTMVATTLMMFAMGKKGATVYASGTGASGYCEISQYDPAE